MVEPKGLKCDRAVQFVPEILVFFLKNSLGEGRLSFINVNNKAGSYQKKGSAIDLITNKLQ